MSNVSHEAITPRFGVNIFVSPDHLLAGDVPEQCLALLEQYGVAVFPGIGASDELQVAFSRRLGPVEGSKFGSDPEDKVDQLGIYPVTLDPTKAKHLDYIISNEYWHMDGTTYQIPPKATNLKCIVPPGTGGDTEFCNL